MGLNTPLSAAGTGSHQMSKSNEPGWMPTKTELKKLLPLGLMFFCILFNYTILRDTKDVSYD
jgi:ATP:ADP antiporter, AAA family